jgi:predicted ATP-dependent serine protease
MLDKYSPYCVIIDSINSHYRVESISTEGIVLFNEILTLLDMLNTSNVYVVVSAQVRNIDGKQEIPGYEYLQLWADVVAYVSRNHPFYRILRIHKPSIDKMFYFDITLDGIRWIRI